jgi:hypothetical protein
VELAAPKWRKTAPKGRKRATGRPRYYTDLVQLPMENIPMTVAKKTKARSRVSNGSKLPPLADGRSVTARRYKDLIDDFTSDLGGIDMVSTAQQQLIRRASMLCAEAERLEAMAVSDIRPRKGEVLFRADVANTFDLERYQGVVTGLTRVFGMLGIERRQRPVNELTLRDIASQMAGNGSSRDPNPSCSAELALSTDKAPWRLH